jgi:hypothetical protein
MKVASGGGLESEHESIEIIEIEVQKFMEMVRDGEIIDSKTLIAAYNLLLQSLQLLIDSGASISAR